MRVLRSAGFIRDGDPLGALRLATFALVAIAIAGLLSVDPGPADAIALAVVAAGSWFSHWYRRRSWLLIVFLAIGMIYLLIAHLSNVIANSQDTRLPLAQMLLWLSVLNSFDMPRRHNLYMAQLVGTVLVIVTATLSRNVWFGAILLAYVLALLAWCHLDALAASGHPARMKPLLREIAAAGALTVAVSALVFLAFPRGGAPILHRLPMSAMIRLPFNPDPGIQNPGYPAGRGDSGPRHVNPNAYYGFTEALDLDYRGRLGNGIALQVRSSRPEYWRAMAFDHYDGRVWTMTRPQHVRPLTSPTLSFELPGQDIAAFGSPEVETVYVEQDQSNLVLLPENARELYFPSSLLYLDDYGSLRSPVTLDSGLYYSVESDSVAWAPRILVAAGDLGPLLARQFAAYLQLPPAFPRRDVILARHLTVHARGPYERVQAVWDYLKRSFPYDLAIGHFPPGVDQVDYFLFHERRGYCEHFASALALLARAVGVPTRLVTGYAPGRYDLFTGYWDIRTRDAHAWIEAYLPGVGWVPFDATPGYSGPADIATAQPEAPGLAWLGYAHDRLGGMFWACLAAMAALAAAVGWSVRAEALNLRLIKRTSPSPEAYRASRAYLRLLSLLARHGIARRAGWSPSEHVREARQLPEVARVGPELEEFARRYQQLRFGPGATGDQVAALERLLGEIRRHLRRRP